MGTANACISIENGLKRWVTLVVVDCKQPWDLLLSNAHLKLLHIQLMTPAMVKQLKRKGRPIPEEGDTVAVDRDSTPDNTVANLPNPELMMPTDQDYAELSETVMITGESPNSEPAPELSTDLELQAQPDVMTIRPRKLRAKIGLPPNFFVHSQGNDFFECDNLYPSVSRASVKSRIKHQLPNQTDEDKLLNKLMDMGASTLREYPSGCPPPAAIKPIKPPMREGAQLMFTVQHPISESAQKVREEFVEPHIKYGIDEPMPVYAQMPVFTLPKPNTTARRVLFDDTTNNCEDD
ncbi:hypothetical protein COEREDRAFT_11320 [Coemansia reversa NRRL 1564]|uniref:Uncharacterized protein n=1 Tax=Coemansia reversa (strain ATCC 12441 / NRRL 1564) TaxID=763665 RepID=A0A2G5B3H7_COERN|nr:hypothetical protein COEREDRAFT_11320 [Coemansia reversa NRRL 1564]|eukprot:PIA13554.1 hypothetical protein COEREDRAFT_11320 [Coemansia reversa NRRL 1564]